MALTAVKPKSERKFEIVATQPKTTYRLTKEAKAAIAFLRKSGIGAHAGTIPKGINVEGYKELKRYGSEIIATSGRGRGTTVTLKISDDQIAPEDAPPLVKRTRMKSILPAADRPLVRPRGDLQATPEEMKLLLRVLETEERRVNEASADANDRAIAELQRRLASAKGDDLSRVYREFQKVMSEREALPTRVRADAFRNVEASDLPEKRFLRLLRVEHSPV